MILGKQLGAGAFGKVGISCSVASHQSGFFPDIDSPRCQVVKADAFGIQSGEEKTVVAVKMVKLAADISYLKALMAELKIMVHLGRYLEMWKVFTSSLLKGTSTLSTCWELARPT